MTSVRLLQSRPPRLGKPTCAACSGTVPVVSNPTAFVCPTCFSRIPVRSTRENVGGAR